MNETVQWLNQAVPEDASQSIGITLECNNCHQFRTFIIEESLGLVARGRISAIGMDTFCEKCENKFGFAIGYVPPGEGFSGKRIDKEDVSVVIDSVGLREHE